MTDIDPTDHTDPLVLLKATFDGLEAELLEPSATASAARRNFDEAISAVHTALTLMRLESQRQVVVAKRRAQAAAEKKERERAEAAEREIRALQTAVDAEAARVARLQRAKSLKINPSNENEGTAE